MGVLLLSAHPRPQCSPLGRNLSELSLFLRDFNAPSNAHMSMSIPSGKGMYSDGEEEGKNDCRGVDPWWGNDHYGHRSYEQRSYGQRRYEYHPGEGSVGEVYPYSEQPKRQSIYSRRSNAASLYKHAERYASEPLGEDFVFHFSKNGELPYGCTQNEISKELTNDEIYFFVTSFFFYLSGKEAFVAYYYYITFLNRVYAHSVRKLHTWYNHLARSHRLPDTIRIKHWEECKADWIKDLRRIEKVSKSLFLQTMKGRRKIFMLKFNLLLHRCSLLWRKAKRNNKRKWTRLLQHKVKLHR